MHQQEQSETNLIAVLICPHLQFVFLFIRHLWLFIVCVCVCGDSDAGTFKSCLGYCCLSSSEENEGPSLDLLEIHTWRRPRRSSPSPASPAELSFTKSSLGLCGVCQSGLTVCLTKNSLYEEVTKEQHFVWNYLDMKKKQQKQKRKGCGSRQKGVNHLVP